MHEEISAVMKQLRSKFSEEVKIAFVSGDFNIIHPGHLRMLNFAADCADILLIAVNDDASPGAIVSEDLRLEGIKAIQIVDYAFIARDSIENLIRFIKPHVVVKGKEHEYRFNPEKEVIEESGGKLLFSSGEICFSSLHLIKKDLINLSSSNIIKPHDYLLRHNIDNKKLLSLIDKFSTFNVMVIGDLIIDEYVTCEALGMSREDPTVVVSPIKTQRFLGGAGIVAAHTRALGAKVSYYGVTNPSDDAALFAKNILTEYGVDSYIFYDDSRPTSLKQRIRANEKTLLRISHLRQHTIDSELAVKMVNSIRMQLQKTDLVIFSDFNYGVLAPALLNQVCSQCLELNIPMVADSQSSSQIGDISRFKNMLLITPTEYEARIAIRDLASGLVVLSESLQEQTGAQNVFLTLGSEGLLVNSLQKKGSSIATDQLPALNKSPEDVSGAGDCLLTSAALSLLAGANIWESAYIGSIAAALQVATLGNIPLKVDMLRDEIRK